MKSKADRYITRVGRSGNTNPMFWVRFTVGSSADAKHISQKCFYDHHYGGYTAAKLAARKWRDSELKRLNISHKHHRHGKYNKKARNTTGVTGVSHVNKWVLKGRKPYHCRLYIVQWAESMPDGTRRYPRKNFSYSGDVGSQKEAFKRAVEFRKEKEALNYNGCV